MASLPARELVRVDLPTPDEPRNATVCPAWHQGRRRPLASGLRASRETTAICGEILWACSDEGAGVGGHIDFAQNDDRGDTGLMGHGNVAFQPRQAEVIVARGHNKCRVEIGSDELFFAIMARCAPFDQALYGATIDCCAARLASKRSQSPTVTPLQARNDRIEINALDMQRVAMHLGDAHGRGLGEGG